MTKLESLKADRAAAQAAYLKIVHTAPAAEVKEASDKVHALNRAISDAITEGAEPCPRCKQKPHGIEQPTERAGVEYEVGCVVCTPFQHTDGTTREPRVRGGMLPRHAVELWNMGPDAWRLAKAKPAPKPSGAPQ